MSKNIGRKICDVFSGRERIRVVLLGSKGTGKTVFMTAVGDHIRHHNGNTLDLHGWSIAFDPDVDDKVQEGVSKDSDHIFPYAKSREYLANGEWPAKTKKCWSVMTVPFTLTKGKNRKQIKLEMLDLPGERVADFAMVGRSYSQWCIWMENRFGGRTGASEYFIKYLKRLSELGDSDSDIERAIEYYKDFLADEYAHLSLSITPSIVKLGLDQNQRSGNEKLFREDLKEVPVGISKDLQFIPLPKESLAKNSPRSRWVKAFSKAYEAYKKSVIAPIASWCKHANSLLYFVDVLELLKRGPEVYNSERRFAEQALGFFKHYRAANIFMKPVVGMKDMFVTHIDNCYVISTKSDCVCKQGDRMAELAKAMTDPLVKTMGLEEGRYGCFSCAAVSTSDVYEKEHAISARIITGKDPHTGEAIIEHKTYLVDDVPLKWPESAQWRRDYNWKTTFPLFDVRDDLPPKQTGLDLIIRRILALD